MVRSRTLFELVADTGNPGNLMCFLVASLDAELTEFEYRDLFATSDILAVIKL